MMDLEERIEIVKYQAREAKNNKKTKGIFIEEQMTLTVIEHKEDKITNNLNKTVKEK